ncbi:MAG TPA: phosphoribosylanthranilate isomerase [Steroidobacteraceae bacterium]|nr:phosphoribosylanthranilate isomerase [Steroidobacteraceae bacterium]
MWIKICGLTSPEAVNAALELRVDALGFVFAESPRRLSVSQAAQLAQSAHGRAQRVAVTRHPTQAAVDEIVELFKPDVLQSDAADLERLRLPASLERLAVVRDVAAEVPNLPARILFEGALSGSGVASDWQLARQLSRRTQLILAGGLDCGNVGAAIARVRPFGVDVSSGVEERPGLKSPARMQQFVEAVRAAARAAAQTGTEDSS